MKAYTLFELNEYIRQVFALNFGDALWINAEIAQLGESRGHHYISLIQKSVEDAEIIAQSEAILWAGNLRQLKRRLGKVVDQILQEGVSVLVQVKIDFHERYGLKLIIEDIDISYTFGKLALERQAIIESLRKKRLLDKNEQLTLPSVVQRIALISSENAAGLQDYISQLRENPYGYDFRNHLFPANVQGVHAEAQILAQLERIRLRKSEFDAVVIIRGGGSKLDLGAFDSLDLCIMVAKFPLPVLSGIGHDIDETVLDLVAHTALKTPTAVAEFLINRNLHFESKILELGTVLQFLAQQQIEEQQYQLQSIEQYLNLQTQQIIQTEQHNLQFLQQQLNHTAFQTIEKAQLQLNNFEQIINLLDPDATLKRGFSITYHQGNPITKNSKLKAGDLLETKLAAQTIVSEIKK